MISEQLLDAASLQDHAAHEFKLDVKNIASAVLARIVEEVKNDELNTSMAYDRVHNRHNR
jgi:hypothetical protein